MFRMDIYRLRTSIVERDGHFDVRVAASLGDRLHGTIAQERRCDSRQAAEITEALLIEHVRAAVRAIGAAVHFAESQPQVENSERDDEPVG